MHKEEYMYGRYLDTCGYGCPYFRGGAPCDPTFTTCEKFGGSIVDEGDDCLGKEDEEEEDNWQ